MKINRLSQTTTGRKWLSAFDKEDRPIARTLLNALVLYNEEEVSHSIRKELKILASERRRKRKCIALYAEREIQEKRFFDTKNINLANGKVRERAVGRKALPPVKPIRGGVRVGSEGPVSNLISQAIDTHRGIYLNTPGPKRFRSSKNPISTIAIVTDFIGSGTRICKMLDKFWAVKTVRSWASTGLVDFVVAAAVGTQDGVNNVEHHVANPNVRTHHTVPTMHSPLFDEERCNWEKLIKGLNKPGVIDEYQFGYYGSAAMVLFNYKIPNNAPSIFWKGSGNIKPLYEGAAPEELRELFRATSKKEAVARVARERGITIDKEGNVEEQMMLLILQEIRGHFNKGTIRQLSETLSLSENDIKIALSDALERNLIDGDRRLTDLGYVTLDANNISRERKVMVSTNMKPYYPAALRAPEGSSSTRRSKERP